MTETPHWYNNLKPNRSGWNHYPVKTVRVPEVLANRILELGHQLDEGKQISDLAYLAQLERELETAKQKLNEFWESLPDEGTILNRLRKRRKKTKATLQDVIAILEICQNTGG